MRRPWKGKFADEAAAAAKAARAAILENAKRVFRGRGFREALFTLPTGSTRRVTYELINIAAHAVLGSGAYALELRGYTSLAVTRLAVPRVRKGRRAIKLSPRRRAIIIADWPAGVPTETILERINALPGPAFTPKQLSTTASGACDVHRPTGFRLGGRRVPGAATLAPELAAAA